MFQALVELLDPWSLQFAFTIEEHPCRDLSPP